MKKPTVFEVSVCVCVCVWERERGGGEREGVCVCVCSVLTFYIYTIIGLYIAIWQFCQCHQPITCVMSSYILKFELYVYLYISVIYSLYHVHVYMGYDWCVIKMNFRILKIVCMFIHLSIMFIVWYIRITETENLVWSLMSRWLEDFSITYYVLYFKVNYIGLSSWFRILSDPKINKQMILTHHHTWLAVILDSESVNMY